MEKMAKMEAEIQELEREIRLKKYRLYSLNAVFFSERYFIKGDALDREMASDYWVYAATLLEEMSNELP